MAKKAREAKKHSVPRLRKGKEMVSKIRVLMSSLKHVQSSGPYSRDEMNER
jgi:hypothetical protein